MLSGQLFEPFCSRPQGWVRRLGTGLWNYLRNAETIQETLQQVCSRACLHSTAWDGICLSPTNLLHAQPDDVRLQHCWKQTICRIAIPQQ